jgi:hypothetical protein
MTEELRRRREERNKEQVFNDMMELLETLGADQQADLRTRLHRRSPPTPRTLDEEIERDEQDRAEDSEQESDFPDEEW